MVPQVTEDAVRDLVAKVLDINPDMITADKPLANLGYDSLDALDVWMDLEETFGIEIEEDEIQGVETLAGLVAVARAAQEG